MTKDLEQIVHFNNVTPESLYDIIMDSEAHSDFTGDTAEISAEVGGDYSVYSGYATGTNLILEPGRRIVQTWRAGDWDEEAPDSTVEWLFADTGKGVKLTFRHKGIPSDQLESIAQGWIDYYWKPLQEYIEFA